MKQSRNHNHYHTDASDTMQPSPKRQRGGWQILLLLCFVSMSVLLKSEQQHLESLFQRVENHTAVKSITSNVDAVVVAGSPCADTITAINQHDSSEVVNPLVPRDQLNFCKDNNFVHWDDDVPALRTINSSRPFSISENSFQRHHDEYCKTSSQLLAAIRNGRRSWGAVTDARNLTVEELQEIPSYFIPDGCDIPYLSPMDYCAAANLYSSIVIQGDSQSRHLHQATLMAYRGDFIQGGNQPPDQEHAHFHRCQCDAQFSRSVQCRALDEGLLRFFQPHQLHMCPALPYDGQFTQEYSVNRIGQSVSSFEGVNCSDTNHRGLLVYVQGGVHWKWKALPVWQKLWRKILVNPIVKDCANRKKLTLIWSGYMAQSPSLDEEFKHQALATGLQFEQDLKAQFKRFRITIPTLEWIALTTGSMRPDGLHFVSEVNYERAQHVMILAKMLREESYHPSLGKFGRG